MSKRGDGILLVFGQQLKHARVRAGYKSAEQFAHKLGISPHCYRTYERGEASPNLETLTSLCEELGCTPNYLLPAAAEPRRPDSIGQRHE
jgi:transcriptional regulator with XRE-family HTH domain